VAAEANNRICNVGVAYDARIGGSSVLAFCLFMYENRRIHYSNDVMPLVVTNAWKKAASREHWHLIVDMAYYIIC